MIGSAAQLDNGTTLRAGICIVGAGAAGIAMALKLKGQGRDVLLLEGGGEVETPENTELYRGEVADPAMHSPTDQYRHRVLGGTTATWGGRCIPFDPIDFEPRDWIEGSGWPIAYDDVARHYPEALAIAEAGDCDYSARTAVEGGMRPAIADFDPPHFDADPIERFSCPTHFGRRYRRHLAEAKDIRVLTEANVAEIVTTPDGGRVDHLVVRTLAGATLRVEAESVVLATGGIEVPRLLLASRRYHPAGIGNGSDLVGRFYMCHIAGTTGEVAFSCDPGDVFHDYERSWDGVYCRRHFQLRPEAQREMRVTNVVLRLHHPRLPDPAHGRGILSAIYLAKPFIGYEYSKRLHGNDKMTGAFWLRHVFNVVREPFGTAAFLTSWAWRRTLAARKFPSLIVRPRNNHYSLDVHAEQVPNGNSRVMLASDTDRFGMPRVRVDWRHSALDTQSIVGAIDAFAADLRSAGKGEVKFDPETVEHDMLRDGAFGGHHIGTTRMADDPARGVVDGDCRVFGVDNLFIASSSVFPTSGQANPTLTILALALRLADHLAVRQTGEAVEPKPELAA